jgi:hypothetical protein
MACLEKKEDEEFIMDLKSDLVEICNRLAQNPKVETLEFLLEIYSMDKVAESLKKRGRLINLFFSSICFEMKDSIANNDRIYFILLISILYHVYFNQRKPILGIQISLKLLEAVNKYIVRLYEECHIHDDLIYEDTVIYGMYCLNKLKDYGALLVYVDENHMIEYDGGLDYIADEIRKIKSIIED